MHPITCLKLLSLFAASALSAAPAGAQCNPQEQAEFNAVAGVTGDRFGSTLARSGDTLVVGAPEANAAYVFERNLGVGGPWVEVATLVGGTASTFGADVAIDGDTIAVGTLRAFGAGNVRIYERDAGGAGNWGEVKKILSSNWISGDGFGGHVALSGDTLLVGAHLATRGSKQESGAAYFFERDQGGPDQWGEVQELSPPAAQWGHFGSALEIEGDRAFVGQPGKYGTTNFPARVRIYERNGAQWDLVKNLFGSAPTPGGQFGASLAAQGDELVVGAPYETGGTVYVFERDLGGAGTWGELIKLRPETVGGQVGWSVDIDGDLLAAGAPWRGAPIDSGRVMLYGRGFAGDAWGQMSKIAATTAQQRDYFGYALALDGGELVGGTDAHNNAGLAYHFEGLIEFPHKYCPSGLSASTCLSVICASGTASATAPSGFVVEALNMEGNKNGLYYFGANGQQASPWGDGRSFQCVVGPVSRGAVISGGGTSGNCDGTFSYDLNARWTQNPNQNPGAGAVVQLQLWTRDPLNTSAQKTILSNALQFTVMP